MMIFKIWPNLSPALSFLFDVGNLRICGSRYMDSVLANIKSWIEMLSWLCTWTATAILQEVQEQEKKYMEVRLCDLLRLACQVTAFIAVFLEYEMRKF